MRLSVCKTINVSQPDTNELITTLVNEKKTRYLLLKDRNNRRDGDFSSKRISLPQETIDILDDFVDEAHELLTSYTYLLQTGKTESVEQEREEAFRCIHNLRTNAQAIGLSVLPEIAKAGENLLNQRKGLLQTSTAMLFYQYKKESNAFYIIWLNTKRRKRKVMMKS